MFVGDYVKNNQPVIYQTFLNALTNKELSHAYLLIGDSGTPLKEVAIYLAKSIICDAPHPLACETCLTCIRVDEDNYADILIFDGEKDTVKKEAVNQITQTFSRTALENKGVVIYIIHLVENMTTQAINALLKFLEEPGPNVYAFLTSRNESRILPTIISRSQTLHLQYLPRKKVIKEAINAGVDENDAQILSFFYNDVNNIVNKTMDEEYLSIKEILNMYLDALSLDKDKALFVAQKEIASILNSKEKARFFLDILTIVFEDILNKSLGGDITIKSYNDIIDKLATKLNHIDKSLVEIMTVRGQIDLNLNIASIIDHITIFINKE